MLRIQIISRISGVTRRRGGGRDIYSVNFQAFIKNEKEKEERKILNLPK